MIYLITNDDGINAAGLKILAEKAKKYGDVYCVAPLKEQSAKSHSLNIRGTYGVQEVEEIIPGVKTFVVDSTPADCVRIAYYYLDINFDMVLSGVNNGYNLGEDILYSGTVGAAEEAVLLQKKGIAFSTKRHMIEHLGDAIDDVFRYLKSNDFLSSCPLLNVNIPVTYENINITRQGKTNFVASYEQVDNVTVMPKGSPDLSRDFDGDDTDVICVHNKNISITPLMVDRTNYQFLNHKK